MSKDDLIKSSIHDITPIKNGMSKEEAVGATKLFLQEFLTSNNILKKDDIYIVENKKYGYNDYKLVTMNDGSQWVEGDKGIDRFCGAHYLKKNLSVDGWSVVETKCMLDKVYKQTFTIKLSDVDSQLLPNLMTIHSNEFISLSRYMGDNKPTGGFFGGNLRLQKAKLVTQTTGYKDLIYEANLREKEDGSIVIIDTEYKSFVSTDLPPIPAETMTELAGAEFTFNLTDFID